MDDTFVVLSAWWRTRLHDPVPKRMAEAYEEAAVSITITSLTDMFSFWVGVATPIPSVQIFCLYTGEWGEKGRERARDWVGGWDLWEWMHG